MCNRGTKMQKVGSVRISGSDVLVRTKMLLSRANVIAYCLNKPEGAKFPHERAKAQDAPDNTEK
jgi:hypothetical protein